MENEVVCYLLFNQKHKAYVSDTTEVKDKYITSFVRPLSIDFKKHTMEISYIITPTNKGDEFHYRFIMELIRRSSRTLSNVKIRDLDEVNERYGHEIAEDVKIVLSRTYKEFLTKRRHDYEDIYLGVKSIKGSNVNWRSTTGKEGNKCFDEEKTVESLKCLVNGFVVPRIRKIQKEDAKCSICMTVLEGDVFEYACRHRIHKQCFLQTLVESEDYRKQSCPLCREVTPLSKPKKARVS